MLNFVETFFYLMGNNIREKVEEVGVFAEYFGFVLYFLGLYINCCVRNEILDVLRKKEEILDVLICCAGLNLF